jgi:hypothetical protein
MLALAQERPRDQNAWAYAAGASFGLPGILQVAKAYAIWAPEQPDVWNIIGFSLPKGVPNRVAYLRRAVTLAPDSGLYAANYTTTLILEGKPEAARGVASRLLQGGPSQRRTGAGLLIAVEAGSARFGAAIERTKAALELVSMLGSAEAGTDALQSGFDVEYLVRHGTSLADTAIERFVLVDPPRLSTNHMSALMAITLCVSGRPELERRCIARLKSLIESGYFRQGLLPPTKPVLLAIERRLAGDFKGAAEAYRTVMGAMQYTSPPLAAETFDLAGDPDTAESLDVAAMTPALNGVSWAHLRAARRAARRGNAKRARELAEQIIAAWSTADIEVDAVREMRELVAKLPR